MLDETGCLEHVMLIGSWAEYAHWRAGLLGGFLPNIRTLDMDFLVRNMRKPIPKAHLVTAARDNGYLVESDRLTGVTKTHCTPVARHPVSHEGAHARPWRLRGSRPIHKERTPRPLQRLRKEASHPVHRRNSRPDRMTSGSSASCSANWRAQRTSQALTT